MANQSYKTQHETAIKRPLVFVNRRKTQIPRHFSAPSPYIVSSWYDRLFFIYSPLIALGLGILLSQTPFAIEKLRWNGKAESWVSVFSGVFTMAHLGIVFIRSHGNPSVFKQYPKRFVWAPVILFTAMAVSSWALVFVFVLAVWWDTYHSGLQTFGLGRMYDLKAGTLSDETRRLDRGLNLLLYLGPILGGAVLMDHMRHFDKFGEVGSAFFTAVPAFLEGHRRLITVSSLFLGTSYLAYYLWRYHRLASAGMGYSRQKLLLFAATGFCSVYTWGFNSFGQAFFIMNFFHALQYFALIWHAEKARIRFLPLLLVFGFGYGLWAKLWGESSRLPMCVLLTVSILHFWYDGFIWSVRRQQS